MKSNHRDDLVNWLKRMASAGVTDDFNLGAIDTLAQMARGLWPPKHAGRGKPKGSTGSFAEQLAYKTEQLEYKIGEEEIYATQRRKYQEGLASGEPKKHLSQRLLKEAQSQLEAKGIKLSIETIRRRAHLAGNKRPTKRAAK